MNTKICPTCEAKNAMNALVCYQCGSTFTSGQTLKVPQTTGRLAHAKKVEKLTSVYTDSFVLFVAGDERPLIVKRINGKMAIGRSIPGEAQVHIDLMEYNAGLLGVSRQHAEIQHVEKGYIIRDLNSTNGTWVNDTRLPPNSPHLLHSGDKMRFGQMTLYIYFTAGESNEYTFFLIDPQDDTMQHRLTAERLASSVSPFLRAMEDIQSLVDDLLGRDHYPMGINSIVVSRQNRTVSVNVDHIKDAKYIIEQLVMPWRRLHADEILNRSDTLKDLQQQLGRAILKRVDEALSEDQLDPYLRRLMPIVQALTFNSIEISNNQVVLEQ